MSRPIPADGTIRYSTGSPGRENAPAVAEPPTTPTRPGSTAAAMAATVSRRTKAPRIFPTNFMLHLSHLSYAAPEITRPTRLECPCSQPHLGVISLLSCSPPWSPPAPVKCGDQVLFESLQEREVMDRSRAIRCTRERRASESAAHTG